MYKKVYFVKRQELEKLLRKYNWQFERHGGRHDIWTNGEIHEAIPRHSEINKFTAEKILKKAKQKQGKKG